MGSAVMESGYGRQMSCYLGVPIKGLHYICTPGDEHCLELSAKVPPLANPREHFGPCWAGWLHCCHAGEMGESVFHRNDVTLVWDEVMTLRNHAKYIRKRETNLSVL